MDQLHKKNNLVVKHKEGFALLMTLIVVGVVLSVGLTILDLSIKQVRLSTNAVQSEISFHAANAGAECARYIRRIRAEDMVKGLGLGTVQCFGVEDDSPTADSIASGSNDPDDGIITKYTYEIPWLSGKSCTVVNTIVMAAEIGGDGLTILNMRDHMPGFPDNDDDGDNDIEVGCQAGSQCTIISVQGFNQNCQFKNFDGTVQREVLLQF